MVSISSANVPPSHAGPAGSGQVWSLARRGPAVRGIGAEPRETSQFLAEQRRVRVVLSLNADKHEITFWGNDGFSPRLGVNHSSILLAHINHEITSRTTTLTELLLFCFVS